jgi:hypothetical protein
MPPGSSPGRTAPSLEHRRRRPAGAEFPHDPCRGPRQPARSAPHRSHMGPGRPQAPAADHARRQGHRLRHGRPRHQAGERHADHEEGHGRRRSALALGTW